jgi:hypothetical protein
VTLTETQIWKKQDLSPSRTPAGNMASVRSMNPNAEIVAKSQALMVNVSAAKGLQGVLKSNLGACVSSNQ